MIARTRRAILLALALGASAQANAQLVLPPIVPRGSSPVYHSSFPYVSWVAYGWHWDTDEGEWYWDWIGQNVPQVPPAPQEVAPPPPPESCIGLLNQMNLQNCSALPNLAHISVGENILAEAMIPSLNVTLVNNDGARLVGQMANEGSPLSEVESFARISHLRQCNDFANEYRDGCYTAGAGVSVCENIFSGTIAVCNQAFQDSILNFLEDLPVFYYRAQGVRACRVLSLKMEERQC
jgi:hypothetical protein